MNLLEFHQSTITKTLQKLNILQKKLNVEFSLKKKKRDNRCRQQEVINEKRHGEKYAKKETPARIIECVFSSLVGQRKL